MFWYDKVTEFFTRVTMRRTPAVNYYPGDKVQVSHRDTGFKFQPLRVFADPWGSYVISFMGTICMAQNEEYFNSVYPKFKIELIERSERI
jgi:hypothetical protein